MTLLIYTLLNMSRIILILLLTESIKGTLLEYNLQGSVGQISFDTSENSLHANSGSTLLEESNDPIYTDRGAYFDQAQILTLPPNPLRPQSVLPINSNFLFTLTFKALSSGCLITITNSLSEKITLCIELDTLKFTQNGLFLVDSILQGNSYLDQWKTVIFGFSSGVYSSCTSLGMILYFDSLCLTIQGTALQTQITDTVLIGNNPLTSQYFKGFISKVYLFSDFESALAKYNSIVFPNGSDLPLYTISGVPCNCGTFSCILDSPDICNKCEDNCGIICRSVTECENIRELCKPYYYDSSLGICDDNILYIEGCVSQSSSSLCLECDIGWVLSPLGEMCCEDGTFYSLGQCLACFMDCKTCDGNGSGDCLSCNDPNAFVGGSGKCKCNTPDYNSISSNPLVCGYKDCNANCISCIGPNSYDCFDCSANNAIVLVSPGPCVCMLGYYESIAYPLECSGCHEDCNECSGLGQSECLTCKEAFAEVLNPPNTCQCKDNYYKTSNDPLGCTPCYTDCLSCFGVLETQCLICKDLNAKISSLTSLCICNTGFYETSTNPLGCSQCHSSCETCQGSSDSECLTCLDSNAVVSSSPGYCLCKPMYYASVLDPLTCSLCSSNCGECSGPSDSDCLSCSDNALVLNTPGMCFCDSGFYMESDTPLVCSACHVNCAECSGPLDTQCLLCNDNNSEMIDICVCKEGYYPISLLPLICLVCDQTCTRCFGPLNTNCLSCSDNNAVISSLNICECIEGYYPKQDDPLVCEACYKDCLACNGLSQYNCTKCFDGSSQEITIYGDCACKDGYYKVPGNKLLCWPCSFSCQTCSGDQSNQCITCKDPNTSVLEGICTCNQGYYKTEKFCEKCNTTCLSCISKDHCTSCSDISMILSNGECECPIKTYFNTSHCESCPEKCQICKSLSSCSQCLDGYFLYNNLCYPCNTACLACNGPEINNCSKCTDDMVLSESSCICKQGKYMSLNYTCNSCMDKCLICYDDFSCLKCEEGFLFSFDELKCVNDTNGEFVSGFEKYIKSIGTVVMSVLVASAVASAFMNSQPSLVWTTLNTAQVLCYIPLHNIALPSMLSTFYKSIQPINILPNFWKTQSYYQCNSKSIIKPFRDYGYTCMYFITNTGEISLALILSIILLILFALLRLITWGKAKVFFNGKIKKFYWNYFIRFWLESFLDIMIPCVISLNNVTFI